MDAPTGSKLFSAVLDSLIQERGVNQVELNKLTGIAVSRINNYVHGKYRTIRPAHLTAIFEALGGSNAENAVLVQAYLLDRISEECRRWVGIRIPGVKETGKWAVPSKGLSPAFAGAFKDLYLLCVSNVKVRQRTAEWVEIMRETKR
jgi:transcriptional regulator with XRE-family HTH domain